MRQSKSFQADRKFWDDDHFPYGFARSGDFSIEQALLLETYGRAYIGLASGERKPVGTQEKDFVVFCQAGKAAENGHEKTWKRYLEKISGNTRRYTLTATASKSMLDDSSEIELEDE